MSSDQAVKRMMLRIIGFPMASVPGWEALARSAYMVLIWTVGGQPWIGMVNGAMYMLPWAWYSQKAQAAAMAAGERDLDAESQPDGPEWVDVSLEGETTPAGPAVQEETQPDNPVNN